MPEKERFTYKNVSEVHFGLLSPKMIKKMSGRAVHHKGVNAQPPYPRLKTLFTFQTHCVKN